MIPLKYNQRFIIDLWLSFYYLTLDLLKDIKILYVITINKWQIESFIYDLEHKRLISRETKTLMWGEKADWNVPSALWSWGLMTAVWLHEFHDLIFYCGFFHTKYCYSPRMFKNKNKKNNQNFQMWLQNSKVLSCFQAFGLFSESLWCRCKSWKVCTYVAPYVAAKSECKYIKFSPLYFRVWKESLTLAIKRK